MNVEALYRARIADLTPKERVRRAEDLFRWVREHALRQVRAEHGDLPEREMRLRVALRLYGSDPRFCSLIEELRGRASG